MKRLLLGILLLGPAAFAQYPFNSPQQGMMMPQQGGYLPQNMAQQSANPSAFLQQAPQQGYVGELPAVATSSNGCSVGRNDASRTGTINGYPGMMNNQGHL